MKITLLTTKQFQQPAIAVIHDAPQGAFHVELEGGLPAQTMESDAQSIDPDALLGRKGEKAFKEAMEHVKRSL